MDWSKMRRLGICLLVAGLIMVFLTAFETTTVPGVALGLFIALGAVDIALVVAREKTISQKIHAYFPQKWDYAILAGGLILTWVVWGLVGFLPVLMGIILGHLFWNGD